MRLPRMLFLRAPVLIVLAAFAVLAPSSPAYAHDGTGGASSDYRITITGYEGDPRGFELRVVELGDRVELRRTSATEVIVLGYEGEPYLRIDAEGVFENDASPAHFLNADRYASTRPPDGLDATSVPAWSKVSSSSTARWHDHRAHWMSPVPPDVVVADPDVERVVHDDRIDLLVDGRAVGVLVEVTWLPMPDRTLWLVTASVLGALVAACVALVGPVRRLMPIVAIDAAVLVTLGQGNSTSRLVIGGSMVAAAIVGACFGRRSVSVVVAIAGAVLAVTRLEVYEHQLLAGWLPGVWQRVVLTAGLGIALGIVAAALVEALGPTEPVAEQPRRVGALADVH